PTSSSSCSRCRRRRAARRAVITALTSRPRMISPSAISSGLSQPGMTLVMSWMVRVSRESPAPPTPPPLVAAGPPVSATGRANGFEPPPPFAPPTPAGFPPPPPPEPPPPALPLPPPFRLPRLPRLGSPIVPLLAAVALPFEPPAPLPGCVTGDSGSLPAAPVTTLWTVSRTGWTGVVVLPPPPPLPGRVIPPPGCVVVGSLVVVVSFGGFASTDETVDVTCCTVEVTFGKVLVTLLTVLVTCVTTLVTLGTLTGPTTGAETVVDRLGSASFVCVVTVVGSEMARGWLSDIATSGATAAPRPAHPSANASRLKLIPQLASLAWPGDFALFRDEETPVRTPEPARSALLGVFTHALRAPAGPRAGSAWPR